MRKFAALFMTLGLMFIAAPAHAGTDDLIKGANGIATSVLDPVFGVIAGDADVFPSVGFADPIVGPVLNRVGGLVTGAITGLNRAATGAFDCATFPITEAVGGAYSPEARVTLISGDGLFDSGE